MASTGKRNGMLTKNQIRKAARLESQVGEPRPGFVRDTACAVEGPAGLHHSFAAKLTAGRKRIKSNGKRIKVSLVFEEDPQTGERRTVRR
jgi:hypothetical protein